MTLDDYETLEDLLKNNGIKELGWDDQTDSSWVDQTGLAPFLSIPFHSVGIHKLFEYEREEFFTISRAKANFLVAFLHSHNPVDRPVCFFYLDDGKCENDIDTSRVYIID